MRTPCPHPSQLLFWVNGSMPPEDAARTAQHVAECPSCRERVAMLRSTVLGQAPNSTELSTAFADTVKKSRTPGLLPAVPVVKLGADMVPTTPFIPAEPDEDAEPLEPEQSMTDESGPGRGSPESKPQTKDLRGPGHQEAVRPEKLQPGDTLGRYVVLDRLGAGGMGVVYAAYDPELDRKVALKLLRPDADRALAAERRTRLLREAQAMARLSHPNVIAVYDVGTFGDAGLPGHGVRGGRHARPALAALKQPAPLARGAGAVPPGRPRAGRRARGRAGAPRLQAGQRAGREATAGSG